MYFLALFFWTAYSLLFFYLLADSFRKARFASFIFSFFNIYFLSIRPIFIFIGLDVPIPSYQFKYDFWQDMVYANLIVFAWAAMSVFVYKYFSVNSDNLKYNFDIVSIRILSSVSIIFTLVGALITLNFIVRFGGISEFVFQVKINKSFAGLYVLREINVWALLLSGYFFLYTKTLGRNKLNTLSLFLIVTNCLTIFAWGNRTIIGFFIFMMAVIYYRKLATLNVRKFVVFALCMLVLANGLRLIREDFRSEAVGHDVSSLQTMSAVTAMSLSMHFSQYDGLLLATRDAGKVFKYRDGEDFINSLTAWVPRFLWPNKPTTFNVGLWFRQIYEPSVSNGWPITSIGDWYVNGGLLLVFFGCALSISLLSAIDRFSNQGLFSDYLILVFTTFVFGQGISTGSIQKTVLTFAPFLFLILLSKIRFRV